LIAMDWTTKNEALIRVIVIGTTGVGKTTFASQLADVLETSHIELDALFWNPDWVPKEMSEFRHLVREAIAQERWVVDGNYHYVRDLIWPRATAVIWLNYSFLTIFWRILWRTVSRAVRGTELYAGNRESLRKSFLSRDSILWWMISTYARRRREYKALRSGNTFPHLAWLEFRRPQQADEFLNSLAATADNWQCTTAPPPLDGPEPG
jgi:adenylate kinase family enzyme